jgi:hypothetical protein
MQNRFEPADRAFPMRDKIVIVGNPVIERRASGWIANGEQLRRPLLSLDPRECCPSTFGHAMAVSACQETLEESKRRRWPFNRFCAVNESVKTISDPSDGYAKVS